MVATEVWQWLQNPMRSSLLRRGIRAVIAGRVRAVGCTLRFEASECMYRTGLPEVFCCQLSAANGSLPYKPDKKETYERRSYRHHDSDKRASQTCVAKLLVEIDYRASLRIPDGHFHKTGFSPFSSATSAYNASRISDPGKGPHLAEEGESDKACSKSVGINSSRDGYDVYGSQEAAWEQRNESQEAIEFIGGMPCVEREVACIEL